MPSSISVAVPNRRNLSPASTRQRGEIPLRLLLHPRNESCCPVAVGRIDVGGEGLILVVDYAHHYILESVTLLADVDGKSAHCGYRPSMQQASRRSIGRTAVDICELQLWMMAILFQ